MFLEYPLRSCPTEWISSEIDHAAHMIRFHPEKVFEDKVQIIIGEALMKMLRRTRSKEVTRQKNCEKLAETQDVVDCFACCEVCSHHCDHLCRVREKCRPLNWLFSWPARRKAISEASGQC